MSCTLHYQQLEDITEEDISNAQPTHVLDTYSRYSDHTLRFL